MSILVQTSADRPYSKQHQMCYICEAFGHFSSECRSPRSCRFTADMIHSEMFLVCCLKPSALVRSIVANGSDSPCTFTPWGLKI